MISSFFVVWMFTACLVVITRATSSSDETILTDFVKPEDLRDVIGTPYLLISESSLERDVSGSLALLDTSNDNAKILLWPPTVGDSSIRSPFADPTCESRTDTIAPHGIDLRTVGSDWEVAVVNHFSYESIEFYRLSGTTLTTAGCTRNLGSGDIHNAVSYVDDNGTVRLGVTLWYERYYGFFGRIEFLWSLLNPFPGGTASLKIVSEGGEATVVRDNLNGANGLVYRGAEVMIVAETAEARILRIDPTTGDTSVLTRIVRIPDNLVRSSGDIDLVWATRIDSSFIQLSICDLLGLFCTLSFSVVEINIDDGSSRDVYSSKLRGQVTAGLIKNNILYVGNFRSNKLLVVPLANNLQAF